MNSKEFINSNDYNEFSFGKFVTERRKSLGMSVRKLASKIGITAAYLSDIEHGSRKAPENYMPQLIEHLQITDKELDNFYKMAYATRGKYFEFKEYLNENYYARVFLRLAKRKNLSNKEWETIIAQISKDDL